MPTSKIENREEAAQAFMEGAYFKVGDLFISPDEIVTARKDDNGNAVFELTTGQKVKHEEFKRGSVGHFLFEQLRKVEGRYVETIKPAFNRLFAGIGNSEAALYNGGGAFEGKLSVSGGRISHYDTGAGYIFAYKNNAAEAVRKDVDTGSNITWPTDLGNGWTLRGLSVDEENKKVYFVHYDGTAGAVTRTDYDGSNPTQILTGTKTRGIAVDPVTEQIFVTGQFVMEKANFDGTGQTQITTSNGGRGGIAVDTSEQKIYTTDTDTVYSLDYSGSTLGSVTTGGDNVAATAPEKGNFAYTLNSSSGEVFKIKKDMSGFDTFVSNSNLASTDGIGIGLDLSEL